jgi:hypothetical protein
MKRRPRTLALLCLFVALAGCASSSSSSASSSSSQGSGSPRVRCLTDPSRDNTSTSRPMFFLFCAESP